MYKAKTKSKGGLFAASADLTKGSVAAHLMRLAIPAAIGFLFNTLYGVVDALFAGFISTEAQAALGFSVPLFFLIIAVSAGVGQGTTALISREIGGGSPGRAVRMLGQGIIVGLTLAALLFLFSITSARPLMAFMGAQGTGLDLACIYVYYIAGAAVVFVLPAVMNGALNAEGDMITFGISLVIASLGNIVFNAIFVLVFGWGITGIALSTIAVQTLAGLFVFWRFRKSVIAQRFRLFHLAPRYKEMVLMLTQAFGAGFNLITIAAGFFVINTFVSRFGDEAVAAFLIGSRVEQLVFLPTIGLNLAALAVTGQNFGANAHRRIIKTYRLAVAWGMSAMVCGSILLVIFARPMVSLFNSDPEVINIGHQFLIVDAFAIPGFVLILLATAVLQGIQRPIFGAMIGLAYRCIIPVFLFLFLAHVLNASLVWYWIAFAILTWITGAIMFSYMRLRVQSLRAEMHAQGKHAQGRHAQERLRDD